MEKNPLESFDEAITMLENAKGMYSQGNHWDAFRTTEKARDVLYKLSWHIELDISLGPSSQAGLFQKLRTETHPERCTARSTFKRT